MKLDKLFLFLLLLGWYFLCYQFFYLKDPSIGDSPQLRSRLGTILWHSSDKEGKVDQAIYDPNSTPHNYCYYPKGNNSYPNKSGEYIIKRQDNGDCSGFYGQAIFYEGPWVSEVEKIWWNKNQKLQDDLVTIQQKPSTI